MSTAGSGPIQVPTSSHDWESGGQFTADSTRIDWSPDGRRLAVGAGNGDLLLLEIMDVPESAPRRL